MISPKYIAISISLVVILPSSAHDVRTPITVIPELSLSFSDDFPDVPLPIELLAPTICFAFCKRFGIIRNTITSSNDNDGARFPKRQVNLSPVNTFP